MTNQVNKNKDSDLPYVLIGCGIFTLVLIITDFTYGNMIGLMHSWVKWPFIILQLAAIVLWITILIGIENPNFDFYRKILLFVVIVALFCVLGHRAGWLSDKAFQEDVEKNKQEQLK